MVEAMQAVTDRMWGGRRIRPQGLREAGALRPGRQQQEGGGSPRVWQVELTGACDSQGRGVGGAGPASGS